MKSDILNNRLKNYDITYRDIINEVQHVNKSIKDFTVFIYCSHMENLGTINSDFDVYVVYKQKSKNIIPKVEVEIKEVTFDIEFKFEEEIDNIIYRLNGENSLYLIEAKLITRLLIAEVIHNSTYGNLIKSRLDKNLIIDNARKMYNLRIHIIRDDFADFYNSKDYDSALILVREMVQESVGMLNLNNGNLNFKPKWYTKIFLNNNGYREDLLKRYKNLYLYPKIDKNDIKNYVEQLLDLSDDMLSYSFFD